MGFKNPRMGLAAHMEGVMNGTFLTVTGFLWSELKIPDNVRKVLYATLLYGTFANWVFTLLAAIFGTSKMTPLSGAGYSGTVFQENLITAGLVSVGLTMIFSLAIIVYGLRGKTN
jgi:hydroxylaminobenzene mutase